jgi:uncharacterized coiled-coil DUF342 family protein
VPEKVLQDNIKYLEKLETLTISKSNDRDLTKEEKSKIDEWKNEIEEQDKELEDAHSVIVNVKKEIRNIGVNIDATSKRIKLVDNHASKTDSSLQKTNKDLKTMLDNIRSGDKLCIDMILIFICLGLAAVLYNIIKSKMGTHEVTQ